VEQLGNFQLRIHDQVQFFTLEQDYSQPSYFYFRQLFKLAILGNGGPIAVWILIGCF
jgi:hypothetical protein